MDNRIDQNAEQDIRPVSFIERQEKYVLAGLGIFSVLVIFLAFFQMYYSLAYPIEKSRATAQNATAQLGSDLYLPEGSAGSALELKAKDTDKDGLNDYDELNIYNTSPYLDDSDSDGVSDQQEVIDGSDPNCPRGKNCSPVVVSEPSNASEGADLADQILSGQLGPDEIRAYLLQSGVAAEEVDALSDDQIMQLYNETIAQIDE